MARDDRLGFWPLFICWALTAAALVARAVLTAGSTPLILDSDDAMRLVMLHDFLAGQGWFDLAQHRLDTPYGGALHWSRLIDLPEAALLGVLRLVFGGMADTAAAFAWPILLLLPLLWLTGRVALRLGGRVALWPALILPGVSLITLAEFAPGRFDHHGPQILLGLLMLLATLEAMVRPRGALVAGVAAGVSLGIGSEGLPIVLATVLGFGLIWVLDKRHAVALRDFGLSFAVTTGLALALGVPPADWLLLRLDAISIVYAGMALLIGLAFLELSWLASGTWLTRLLTGAIAAVVVAAILVEADPALLRGPYAALDPWLVANWLDNISEAQSWLESFWVEPVYPITMAVPCLLALGIALWTILRRPQDRRAWLVYGLFLLVAVAVMAVQIRGARLAVPLALPACAILVGAAWRRVAQGGIGAILAALGASLASAGVAVAVAATAVVLMFPAYAEATTDRSEAARRACLMPSAFADLAGLPPERIMAPIDLGSHLLLHTPHSVVAAPYHRNQQALLDTFRFFNGPIEEGRDILRARGIGLVVICPAMREIRGMVESTADSFVALYADGMLPDWLVEQSLPASPLRIYVARP